VKQQREKDENKFSTSEVAHSVKLNSITELLLSLSFPLSALRIFGFAFFCLQPTIEGWEASNSLRMIRIP
jgi:hypothetical protein